MKLFARKCREIFAPCEGGKQGIVLIEIKNEAGKAAVVAVPSKALEACWHAQKLMEVAMTKERHSLIEIGCPKQNAEDFVVVVPTRLLEEIDEAVRKTAEVLKAHLDVSHNDACQHARHLLMHMSQYHPTLPVVDDLGAAS